MIKDKLDRSDDCLSKYTFIAHSCTFVRTIRLYFTFPFCICFLIPFNKLPFKLYFYHFLSFFMTFMLSYNHINFYVLCCFIKVIHFLYFSFIYLNLNPVISLLYDLNMFIYWISLLLSFLYFYYSFFYSLFHIMFFFSCINHI